MPDDKGFRNELTYKLLRDPDLALVAEQGGEILGAALGGYDGRTAWVSRLGVRADVRGQGIGGLLARELLRRLAELGAPTDDLVIVDDSADTHVVWQALGFVERPGAARYTRTATAAAA